MSYVTARFPTTLAHVTRARNASVAIVIFFVIVEIAQLLTNPPANPSDPNIAWVQLIQSGFYAPYATRRSRARKVENTAVTNVHTLSYGTREWVNACQHMPNYKNQTAYVKS